MSNFGCLRRGRPERGIGFLIVAVTFSVKIFAKHRANTVATGHAIDRGVDQDAELIFVLGVTAIADAEQGRQGFPLVNRRRPSRHTRCRLDSITPARLAEPGTFGNR